jgi:hypothetical protein
VNPRPARAPVAGRVCLGVPKITAEHYDRRPQVSADGSVRNR